MMKKVSMRIHIITPVTTGGIFDPATVRPYVQAGTEIAHAQIESGPAYIESGADAKRAAPDTVKKLVEAEEGGADAVIINCFGDPALMEGRERCTISVIGPGECSMHLAAAVVERFSIITILDAVVPLIRRNAERYGVQGKLASIRPTGLSVADTRKDAARLIKILTAEARKAVDEDGAAAIILGCTGMFGLKDSVRSGLKAKVPMIDPLLAAIKFAEMIGDDMQASAVYRNAGNSPSYIGRKTRCLIL
jgi:allantoin racemase